MKKGILLISASFIYLIFFILQTGEQAHTFSSQPPAFNASAPGQGSCGAGGLGCHSSSALNSGMGGVSIDFDGGSNSYMPDQTYTINVTVEQMGASRFGFQMVALDAADATSIGNFTITNASNTSTQSSAGIEFINHLNAPSNNDSFTFSFDWTAPSTGSGDVNFYVSGNAADGSFNAMGDNIYSSQLSISEGASVSNDFEINAKVLLEAMWDGTAMTTQRNQDGLLPNTQPFGSLFGYNGSEMVTSFPVNAVDWILLSLKDASENIVGQSAGILLSDGTITSVNNGIVSFSGVPSTGNYTLVVHHQSHLGMASSIQLSSGSTYDFSTSQSQAAGIEQQKLVNGAYAMYSGDYDGNGNINNLDFNLWANNNAAVNQYLSHDADGNGIVNNLDYNSWELNRSKVGDPSAAL